MSTKGITPDKCKDKPFMQAFDCVLEDAISSNPNGGGFNPGELDPKTKAAYDKIVNVGQQFRQLQAKDKNQKYKVGAGFANAQIAQLISDTNTCAVMEQLGTFKLNQIFGWDQEMQDAMFKTYCKQKGIVTPSPDTVYVPPRTGWFPNNVSERLRADLEAMGPLQSFTVEAKGVRRNYTSIAQAVLDSTKFHWKSYTLLNVVKQPPPQQAPGMIAHWTDPEKLPQHVAIVVFMGTGWAIVARYVIGPYYTGYTPILIAAGAGATFGLVMEYYYSMLFDKTTSFLNPLKWF